MTIYLSLFVALVGLVIYLICNGPNSAKPAELGRIMFAMGLLAFLLTGIQEIIKVVGK